MHIFQIALKQIKKPLKPSTHSKKALTVCKFGSRPTSNRSKSNPSLKVDNAFYFLYKDQSGLYINLLVAVLQRDIS